MTTDDPRPPEERAAPAEGARPQPMLPLDLPPTHPAEPEIEPRRTPPLSLEAVTAALDEAEAPDLAAPSWYPRAAEAMRAAESAPEAEPEPMSPRVPRATGPGLVTRLIAQIRSAVGLGEPGTPVWPAGDQSPRPPRRSFRARTAATLAPPLPGSVPDLADAPETLDEVALAQEALEGEAPLYAPVAARRTLRLPFPWNAFIAVLVGAETTAFLMFLLLEPTPRWVLLVAAGAAVAGTDGVLRATYREPFEAGADTTPYLFLPALYAFAAPLIIEHNATGYAVLGWGLAAGVGFGAITVAEVMSVRAGSRAYPYARLVASAGAYFAAFGLLAVPYLLHLGLPSSIVAAWLVCTMLGIELLREGEIDPLETTIFAATAALFVAQTRWLLFFLPLDGYLAGLTLLLVFFLVIGVLHAHVMRQLTAWVAGEYVVIAAIGLGLVVAARAAGIA